MADLGAVFNGMTSVPLDAGGTSAPLGAGGGSTRPKGAASTTHWTFGAERVGAAQARAVLRNALRDIAPEQREVAVLLTSELVANAVLHGSAPIDVDLDLQDHMVRISVHDAGSMLPKPSALAPADESGRGLRIVDSLAERWGVTVQRGGKSVWFERA